MMLYVRGDSRAPTPSRLWDFTLNKKLAKLYHLGTFRDRKDAEEVRQAAEYEKQKGKDVFLKYLETLRSSVCCISAL